MKRSAPKKKKKIGHNGDWTHDQWLIRPTLYRLSYAPLRCVVFGWCSWLSRQSNTLEVASSILASNTFFFFFFFLETTRRKRQWCIGNIEASQALAPGSIPGWRIFLSFSAIVFDRCHVREFFWGQTQKKSHENLKSMLFFQQKPKKFPRRDLNPGLAGESRIS